VPVLIDIADAVVSELNAATFSVPLTAQRGYRPVFELGEMTALHVTVVPHGQAGQALDRNRDSFDYAIDVAVQQKVEPTNVALDALMALVEEIADHFRRKSLPGFPAANCVEVKNDPVYSLDHLEEFRAFTSVIALTFRVWR
jgi:hypothetical protein